jgi:hypothetical protein
MEYLKTKKVASSPAKLARGREALLKNSIIQLLLTALSANVGTLYYICFYQLY